MRPLLQPFWLNGSEGDTVIRSEYHQLHLYIQMFYKHRVDQVFIIYASIQCIYIILSFTYRAHR